MRRAPDAKVGGSEGMGNQESRTPILPAQEPHVNKEPRCGLFESTDGPVSKGYALDEGSRLVRKPGGKMTSGIYKTISVARPSELALLLSKLKPTQFLTLGVADRETATVTYQRRLARLRRDGKADGIIAVTKECLASPRGPGLFLLDKDGPGLSRKELWEKLCRVFPGLSTAPAVLTSSASSHIWQGEWAEVRGEQGQHLYLMVEEAADLERAGAAIFKRLVLAGEAGWRTSANGSVIRHSLLDPTVFQAARKIFAGRPWFSRKAVEHCYCVRRPAATVLNDDQPYLDTSVCFPDLSGEEEAEFERIKDAARASLRPVNAALSAQEAPGLSLDASAGQTRTAVMSHQSFLGPRKSDHDEFVRWLEEDAPPAIEGSGGDATTYKVACILRDHGATQEEAVALLEHNYNGKCLPPWSHADLAQKVANAYSYALGEAGGRCLLIEPFKDDDALDAFASAPEAAHEPVSYDWSKFSAGRFLDTIAATIRMLADCIPENCVSLLFGPHASLKSSLVLSLAVSVATGLQLLRGILDVRAQGPVVYLDFENPENVLHCHLKRLFESRRQDAVDFGSEEDWTTVERRFRENLIVRSLAGEGLALARATPLGLKPTRFFEESLSAVESIAPKLVVIDTVSRALPGAETDNALAAEAISLLERFSRVSGCAVVALHHANKASQTADRRDRSHWKSATEATAARGASAFCDNARAAVGMVGVPVKSYQALGYGQSAKLAYLRVAKNSYAADGREVYLTRTEDGGLAPFIPVAKTHSEPANLEAMILAEISRRGGEHVRARDFCRDQPKAWIRAGLPKVSQRALEQAVKELEQAGKLRFVQHGALCIEAAGEPTTA